MDHQPKTQAVTNVQVEGIDIVAKLSNDGPFCQEIWLSALCHECIIKLTAELLREQTVDELSKPSNADKWSY